MKIQLVPLVVDSPVPKWGQDLVHMQHTSVNQKTFPAHEMNANIWTLLQLKISIPREIREVQFSNREPIKLTLAQYQALLQFENNYHLEIKACNKVGVVVVMDNTQYENICQEFLRIWNGINGFPS